MRQFNASYLIPSALAAAAYYIEVGILFTVIVFDMKSGVMGSLSLFLVLCIPYSISSYFAPWIVNNIGQKKSIWISHLGNGLCLLLFAITTNPSIWMFIIIIKSSLRAIAAVAEFGYVRKIIELKEILSFNIALQTTRQIARLCVPVYLIIFNNTALTVGGLFVAAIFYLIAAFIVNGVALNNNLPSNEQLIEHVSSKKKKIHFDKWVHPMVALIIYFLSICFDAIINTLYPQLAIMLDFPRTILAEMMFLGALGGIIGPLLLGRMMHSNFFRNHLGLSLVLMCISVAILTYSASIGIFSFASFRLALIIDGMILSATISYVISSIQNTITENNLIKIGAYRNAILGVAAGIGPVIGAYGLFLFGVVNTIQIVVVLMILTIYFSWRYFSFSN